MRKILSLVVGKMFALSSASVADKVVSVEKQLIGIIGAVSVTIKTNTR